MTGVRVDGVIRGVPQTVLATDESADVDNWAVTPGDVDSLSGDVPDCALAIALAMTHLTSSES
jgi:hypothetical protein